MTEPDETFEQRREFYRIRFPEKERPWLHVDSESFEILDLSEHGLRFEHPLSHSFRPGAEIDAKLTFADGTETSVVGHVLRSVSHHTSGETILQVARGIPSRLIMQQQSLLIRKYPGREF
jgi:hypothetical protein